MPDIGKRIRQKREEQGITQEDLAKKLGYKNKSTIAKIENGTNDIVQSKVAEFANVLDTTIAYLMGWESEFEQDRFSSEGTILAAKVAKNPELKQLITHYESANETGKLRILENAADMARLYSKEQIES